MLHLNQCVFYNFLKKIYFFEHWSCDTNGKPLHLTPHHNPYAKEPKNKISAFKNKLNLYWKYTFENGSIANQEWLCCNNGFGRVMRHCLGCNRSRRARRSSPNNDLCEMRWRNVLTLVYFVLNWGLFWLCVCLEYIFLYRYIKTRFLIDIVRNKYIFHDFVDLSLFLVHEKHWKSGMDVKDFMVLQ